MFTHIDENGNANMVDVSKKNDSLREAIAQGSILLNEEIINAIVENRNKKGDVLSTSRLAGIQGAKRTSDLIPLAHNLNLTKIVIEFSIDNEYIWEEPNNHFLHHELIKLPDGNYLGLIVDIRIGPIPYGPWTTLFQALGYQANGFSPEFPWVGDKIVIWDKDTKEIIWEWNTFDYYLSLIHI